LRRALRLIVLPNSALILDRLTGLHPKLIDLSLGRIERLLDRLGRPQDRLPFVVHVAGTNGKGSVLAFLRAMLEAAGLKAHVYTSPHLVRFTERIVVAGREIEDARLSAILEECEEVNAGAPITFFEITTAAAFLAFARSAADVTLLETGLGGRLDATNVVRAPALTAITPISFDHQSYLGDTLGAIAAEKAGILKPGVACISAAQPPEAARVIRARACLLGAPLAEEGREWSVWQAEDGRLVFRDGGEELSLPAPRLEGVHQYQNAGVAIACARRLPAAQIVGSDAIGRGLARVVWPARLQRLERGRLGRLLPAGWELWLDGGHNPGAAAALARHLEGWRDRPLFLVFGMLKSKDADAFLATLARFVERMATLAVPGENASLGAEEAATIAARHGIAATPVAGLAEALALLAAADGRPSRVLICGSLYLAGAVLASNEMP
jgi:dihydrofolate synthase / folylpolyglutamate synthase